MVSILSNLYKKKKEGVNQSSNVTQKLFLSICLNLGGIGPTPTLPISASGGV